LHVVREGFSPPDGGADLTDPVGEI